MYKVTKDFITEKEEEELLKYINNQKWMYNIKRATQQYNYSYLYNSPHSYEKTIKMPDELQQLCIKCYGIYDDKMQCIINRYLPGEGIGLHTDSNIFEKKIISLSLGSAVNFNVRKDVIYLEPRTLLTMYGSVIHGIDARKTDDVNGKRIKRDIRISITFRRIK